MAAPTPGEREIVEQKERREERKRKIETGNERHPMNTIKFGITHIGKTL